MNNSKNKILIGIVVVLLIVTLIVIYLGTRESELNNSNNPDNNNPNNNNIAEISKSFSKVKNYNEFFSVQNTINDNLEITQSYICKEIYTNNDSTTKYYFVNGSITESLMDDETTNYEESVNYLLIVKPFNNSYKIIKLNKNIPDLLEYAKNYDIKHQEINSSKRMADGTDSLPTVLKYYLEHFKSMLFFDIKLSYDMLLNETKNKYNGYLDFYNQRQYVYDNISSSIFSYSQKKFDDYTEYYIKDEKQRDIKIIEYGIMNYKISY